VDKSKREKDGLYDWACENSTEELSKKIFNTSIDKDAETYFYKREKEDYLKKYLPETVGDLDTLLQPVFSSEVMQKVKKYVRVACIKNKPDDENCKAEHKEGSKLELSGYIYNF